MMGSFDRGDWEPVTRDSFASALSCFANGVTILTTDGVAGRFGRTVSSACSLCATPPAVLACVDRSAAIADAVVANGAFCISAAGEAHRPVCDAFAGRPAMPMDARFALAEWVDLVGAQPGLADAAAAVGCALASHLDFGSHRILIGVVCDARTGSAPPLLYGRRSFGRLVPLED